MVDLGVFPILGNLHICQSYFHSMTYLKNTLLCVIPAVAYLLTYILTLYLDFYLTYIIYSDILSGILTEMFSHSIILSGILPGIPPRLIFLDKVHPILLAATFQFWMNVRYGRGYSGTEGTHGLSSWSCIVAEAFRPEGFESIQGNGFCSSAKMEISGNWEGRHLSYPLVNVYITMENHHF